MNMVGCMYYKFVQYKSVAMSSLLFRVLYVDYLLCRQSKRRFGTFFYFTFWV